MTLKFYLSSVRCQSVNPLIYLKVPVFIGLIGSCQYQRFIISSPKYSVEFKWQVSGYTFTHCDLIAVHVLWFFLPQLNFVLNIDLNHLSLLPLARLSSETHREQDEHCSHRPGVCICSTNSLLVCHRLWWPGSEKGCPWRCELTD